jgi:alcohol dehydrogenase class IV
MERVREILDLSGIRYGVFNGVEPETLVEIVKAAAEAARGAGYDIMTGQVTI